MGNKPSSTIPAPTKSTFDEKDSFMEVSDALSVLRVADPFSSDGSLTLGQIAAWEYSVAFNSKVKLARTVLSQTDIRSALTSRSAGIADQHVFNQVLDFKTGPITDQKNSGRGWLFAATNVIRYSIMKQLKLKDFQLSQSFLFFWDKLNKSNYYLELMIENASLPIDDRLIHHLSGDALVSDGGQWDMVVNLIKTYGLVPQSIYPESTHSSLSDPLNTLLKAKLREHALTLRTRAETLRSAHVREEIVVATLRAKKEELLKEIYNILTATLGVPPQPSKKFVWEYIDADDKAGRWEGTPQDFVEQLTSKPYSPLDCISLVNDPRHEYSKLYTVDKLGNVWGGKPVQYVNIEMENMKALVIKTIKAGQPIFIGCDVGKSSVMDSGIMDTSLFEYENAFDIKLCLSKTERLQIRESAATHAMVICGVHLDQAGKPIRYKVENSWGKTTEMDGDFVMSDSWFDQYVYQVVVPKALAPKELIAVYDSAQKVVLSPWDSIGPLAYVNPLWRCNHLGMSKNH